MSSFMAILFTSYKCATTSLALYCGIPRSAFYRCFIKNLKYHHIIEFWSHLTFFFLLYHFYMAIIENYIINGGTFYVLQLVWQDEQLLSSVILNNGKCVWVTIWTSFIFLYKCYIHWIGQPFEMNWRISSNDAIEYQSAHYVASHTANMSSSFMNYKCGKFFGLNLIL